MSDTQAKEPKFGIGPVEKYISMCSEFKKDLWKSIQLFHKSLTSWYLKCHNKESFRDEITSFLSIFIEKTKISSSMEFKNSSNIENSLINKIQKNRNMKMINLCKQMFDQIDTHRSIVGGFIQARVIASKLNGNSQVLLIGYSHEIH